VPPRTRPSVGGGRWNDNGMNDERPVVDETVDEAEDEDEVQFWPIWRTAARSLRKGDQIAGPVGPQTFLRATIADLQEDEPSGTIPIIAELVHPLATLLPQP
jgi:hypothetical protein